MLLDSISVEIEMKLDMLSYLKDVKVSGRNFQDTIFNETARHIYEAINCIGCPESAKVF